MAFSTPFFNVVPIPLLKDNYAYLLRCLSTNQLAIVDVAKDCAMQVQNALEALVPELDLKTNFHHLLTTHKHWDHSGGNADMLKLFPHLQITAGVHEEGINAAVHRRVADGQILQLGDLSIRVLHTPAHTTGHVLFHVTHPQAVDDGVIFTGDTLFIGGCGRTFEGTAEQMITALRRIMTEIPGTTRVCCGHEYTLMYMERFKHLEPENTDMRRFHEWVIERRKRNQPTVGTLLQDERLYNMYIRAIYGLWKTPDVVEMSRTEEEAITNQFLKAYNVPR